MNPRRVLIVEDDATLLRALRDTFESQGFTASSAADGEAGLRTALVERFDLILLDVMLPRRNGFEICLELRRSRIASPILMLSAKGHESDVVHGLELGADDYVTKPFRTRELLARARALLRRVEGPQERVIEFGEFQLDRIARTLSRGGVEVRLTKKECLVLDHLLRHEGRPVTRRQLLDAVWGGGAIVTPRSVDRFIATLRAKIEPDVQQPIYIHTLHDVGYRFDRNPTEPETSQE